MKLDTGRLDADKLYELLPAVYRVRDSEQNGVLRELIRVIAEQVAVIEEDLGQLYDDQFIETCAPWVIPYLGDLIGFKPVYSVEAIGTTRAEVANTLAFRSRKGTASMLEELANDTTGWDAVVVEFFQRVATTQYLNHIRLNHHVTANVGDSATLADIGTPFDSVPHNIDVRRIASRRGLYNIPNIGIFLWRIQSYAWEDVPVSQVDNKRFRFHPLGIDMPLYNLPAPERAIEHLATRENVPMPLKRRYLKQFLDKFYGVSKSVAIHQAGQLVPLNQIHICDLSDTGSGQWANMPASGVSIDPELGRIAFSSDVDVQTTPLQTKFYYGFCAPLGGGSYDRLASLASHSPPILVPLDLPDLQTALNAANGSGIVQIENSDIYTDDPLVIVVDADTTLTLQAGDGKKPLLATGTQVIVGGGDGGEIEINGLMLTGAPLRIPDNINGQVNKLQKLRITHCTLLPGISVDSAGVPQQSGAPSLIVDIPELQIEIEHSIIGALRLNPNADVVVKNSIIDANDSSNLAYSDTAGGPGGSLDMLNSTVIGSVKTRLVQQVSNSILTGMVTVERVQQGCMRFSYVPIGSKTPKRYRCLPINAEQAETVQPFFTSLLLRDAGYCQLRYQESVEIANGADDESEMGAYHDLQQAKREINLRVRLQEYLRFGLEAGIFYVS